MGKPSVLKKHFNYKRKLFKRIIIFAFLMIFAGLTLWASFLVKKTIILKYKESSDINYLVYLKPNDFYADTYLPKGMQYIASSIDYIDATFNYNFEMNDELEYNYYYYVEADVKVFEANNQSNVIFEKKEKLINNKTFTDQEGLSLSVGEDLKINYGEYNDLIRNFKSSYNIYADSTLTLTMYVYIVGKHESLAEPIRIHNAMNLVIPLTEQTLDIELDYKDINNSDIITETSTKGTPSGLFLEASAVLMALSLISLVDIIRYAFKVIKRKTPYQKKINSILREYDRVIVEITNSNALSSDTNFLEAKSFEELLDVSDRLEQPILFYEIQKGKRSEFIVRKDNDTYFYVIDSEDFVEGV